LKVAVSDRAEQDDGDAPGEIVLVTGSSSGIGKACCERLARGGRRIYGACRTPYTGNIWQHLTLDVDDDASVQQTVEEVVYREGGIDALVHCAGFSLAGAVEDTAINEAKAQFETNFFGTVRLVRAVVSFMRKRRRGKIIVVGSIGGLIGLPFIGHYSASKFALSGFIEALRLEVARFGIDATILHPGDFNTAISTNQVRARSATSESCYGETFEKIVDRYDRNVRTARSPHVVARKVEKLLKRRRMPSRCIVGTPIEVLAVRLKAAIPGRGFEDLFRRFYGL
jgi:NAD(P)-dependent dehydrogenase (short-subunit alcohol dehydrogenase family)